MAQKKVQKTQIETYTKSDVGLANVDNTADTAKPVSTATQTALDAKVTGPASATDNAIARFDSTTGKLLQGSGLTISDADVLSVDTIAEKTAAAGVTIDGVLLKDNGIVMTGTLTAGSVQPTSGILASSVSQLTSGAASAQVLGSSSTAYMLSTSGIALGTTANASHSSLLVRQNTYTEAPSGTHPLFASAIVRSPVITNGTATTTNAVTMYIEGAPTGTATPTNVYALWVDDGAVRIDGTLDVTTVNSVADLALIASSGTGIIEHTATQHYFYGGPMNGQLITTSTSAASASSLTPNVSSAGMFIYTALAANLTINAPTNVYGQGQKLMFRFKDNGTSRTLTWNAIFRAIGVALPANTVINKTLYVGCIYNSTDTKWDVVMVNQEA